MNHTLSLILFLVLLIHTSGSAQSNPQFSINEVSFLGNKKTKTEFLERSLNLKPNVSVTEKIIAEAIQRIKNLSSIESTFVQIDTLADNSLNIKIDIQERITALPIVNFGGIKNNLWFSIGLHESNFRKQGETALAFYQNNDGLHSGEIFYRKPNIGNRPWGFSLGVRSWTSEEPLYFTEGTFQYIYNNSGINFSLIRNLNINSSLEIGGNFFIEKYSLSDDHSQSEVPGPMSLEIKKILSKFEWRRNFLNYDFFYLKGHESILTYQNVYGVDFKDLFNSISLQTKYFIRPTSKLNIAFRLKMAISTNNDSPFAPFVADSHVNIRGVGNRIDRGTAQFVLNSELRSTLIHVNKWASQFILFSDTGTWRNPGGTLDDLLNPDQFKQFVGLGFRLIYRKVFGATIRVDYGVDVFNTKERGFVIGLGQYF